MMKGLLLDKQTLDLHELQLFSFLILKITSELDGTSPLEGLLSGFGASCTPLKVLMNLFQGSFQHL